jgi:hypothetical protein
LKAGEDSHPLDWLSPGVEPELESGAEVRSVGVETIDDTCPWLGRGLLAILISVKHAVIACCSLALAWTMRLTDPQIIGKR